MEVQIKEMINSEALLQELDEQETTPKVVKDPLLDEKPQKVRRLKQEKTVLSFFSFSESADFVIDTNPEKNGSSFQLFEWIDHSVSEFEVLEDINHGDEEMIIEEKQMIDKSKKKRKEKAQGFEMT